MDRRVTLKEKGNINSREMSPGGQIFAVPSLPKHHTSKLNNCAHKDVELEVSKSCDIESPNKRKGRESTPESKKRRVSLRSHSDLHSSPHEMSTRSKINIDKTPKPSTLGLPSKELYYSGCPDYKQIQKQLAMKCK